MLLKCYGHGRKGAIYAVIDCKLKQNANEGCNSCASLAGHVLCVIACFILLVIAPLVSERLLIQFVIAAVCLSVSSESRCLCSSSGW